MKKNHQGQLPKAYMIKQASILKNAMRQPKPIHHDDKLSST